MNDETATSAIDEITRLVTRYAEGFAGDPLATIEFYALPMIYVGLNAVSVIGSREEAVVFVEGILERLRPTGFSRTTVERCTGPSRSAASMAPGGVRTVLRSSGSARPTC
jgi:hypothetical protein